TIGWLITANDRLVRNRSSDHRGASADRPAARLTKTQGIGDAFGFVACNSHCWAEDGSIQPKRWPSVKTTISRSPRASTKLRRANSTAAGPAHPPRGGRSD